MTGRRGSEGVPPSGAFRTRRRPRRFRLRRGPLVGAAPCILALLLSAPGLGGASGHGAPPPPSSDARPPPALAPASREPVAGPSLLGADPAGSRPLDVPALAATLALSSGAGHPTASAPTRAPAAPTARAPSPIPAAGGSTGTLVGVVLDSVTRKPVVGVAVTVVSVYGFVCACPGANTGTDGSFSVESPVGPDELSFSLGDYVTNHSWASAVANTTVSVGTLYLVHDAWVKGVVESALPGHFPIADVDVMTFSRDGAIEATPIPPPTTPPNGTFLVPLPPVPSRIVFMPDGLFSPVNASRFQSNWTYANATPYETVDLGPVYLEGGVPVHARFVDRLTGLPIAGTIEAALQICSTRGVGCVAFPPVSGGTSVGGYAIPGPTTVVAEAVGYVSNHTAVPDVPNSATSVDLGTIDLEPLGALETSTNFTGGRPSPTGWAAGEEFTVTICSLDGLETVVGSPPILTTTSCLYGSPTPMNTTVTLPGFPLRDVVVLWAGDGAFPLEYRPFETGIAGFPDAEWNLTWVNLTPDQVVELPSFDATPGTYVAGNVSIAGVTGSLADRFSVTICSTDEVDVCGPPVLSSSELTPPPLGCPVRSDAFCAMAPPGPDVVTVTALANATMGAASNETWIDVPRGCCAQDGHPMWIPPSVVNLTPLPAGGMLTGTVDLVPPGGGTPELAAGIDVGFTICPADAAAETTAAGCDFDADLLVNGTFRVDAPSGWDRVVLVAQGFETNGTWIDVTGVNATGTIVLEPDALVAGRIVDPTGSGIYDAEVTTCPVSLQYACLSVAGVATATDGSFNVTVPGGGIPVGTIEVYAEASGYEANWTWTVAAAGILDDLGTITLAPVGTLGPAALRPLASAPTGSAWVTGTVVDNATGLSVPGAAIEACPIPGTTCLSLDPEIPTGGGFNVSIARGPYDLVFSSTGYYDTTVYVNLTGTLDALGTVRLAPYAWVRGILSIAPWESLRPSIGLGAPSVSVLGCDSTGDLCGPLGRTATDGSFNVSVPFGSQCALTVAGLGYAVAGSMDGGYATTEFSVAVSTRYVTLPSADPSLLALPILGGLSGFVANGLGFNATAGVSRVPAGFGVVAGGAYGASTTASSTLTGGGGYFVLYLLPGGSRTGVNATGLAFLTAADVWVGPIPVATVEALPNLTLPHYGWIELSVDASGTGMPIAGASITASVPDPANGTRIQSVGATNEAGFANVSAPPGAVVTYSVAFSGYTSRTGSTGVAPGETTRVANVSLRENASQAPSWLQSEEVNTVGHPPTVTVVDAATGAPLNQATVDVTSPTAAPVDVALETNGLGQFLVAPNPGDPDTLSVSLPGYVTSGTYETIAGGTTTTVDRVNLTGDGILGGEVLDEPGGAPVADVTIEGCRASTGACPDIATTNGQGQFWLAAPPGIETVTVSTDAYLANESVNAQVTTDTWSWIGALDVYTLGAVVGTVRGLPSALPLANATVAICGTYFLPYGPCDESVVTGPTGTFSVPTPPGRFELVISAPLYNITYFPVSVEPGESLPVGTVFLIPWGSIVGTVLSALDDEPVPGATVTACADWSPTFCAGNVTTDGRGEYQLLAPPSEDTVLASDPGFLDNSTRVDVAAGEPNLAPTLWLTPVAPDLPETVTGTVVRADNPAVPIGGAFVALESAGLAVYATQSASDGSFAITGTWGTFLLVARAPGFVPWIGSIILHTNSSGHLLALAVFDYGIRGTVTDRSTGAPIAGIAIATGATTLAVTDATGAYAFDLPNGSYALTASPLAAEGYDALAFSLTVAGSDAVRNLSLTPTGTLLAGTVVDVADGLPVPGAVAELSGGAVPSGLSATTGVGGTFAFHLAPGSYTLTVRATGYVTQMVPVTITNESNPLTVALVRASGPGAAAGPPVALLAGIAAAIAAAVVVAVVLSRRRPPPPPPNRWGGTLAPDDVDEEPPAGPFEADEDALGTDDGVGDARPVPT